MDGGRKQNEAEVVLQSNISGQGPLSFEHQSEGFNLYTSTERKPMEFLKHEGRDTRLPLGRRAISRAAVLRTD